MRQITLALLAISSAAACSTNPTETQGPSEPDPAGAEAFRFEAYQIARFAAESRRVDFRRYRQNRQGNQVFTFDEVHRHPFLPEGPAVVDCATTRYLGVRFQLHRKNRRFLEKVNRDVVWRHEGVDGLVDEHSYQEIFWEGQTQQLFTEFLDTSHRNAGEWRKDGVVTVQIRLMGRLLVENAFELRGCERALDAPSK